MRLQSHISYLAQFTEGPTTHTQGPKFKTDFNTSNIYISRPMGQMPPILTDCQIRRIAIGLFYQAMANYISWSSTRDITQDTYYMLTKEPFL